MSVRVILWGTWMSVLKCKERNSLDRGKEESERQSLFVQNFTTIHPGGVDIFQPTIRLTVCVTRRSVRLRHSVWLNTENVTNNRNIYFFAGYWYIFTPQSVPVSSHLLMVLDDTVQLCSGVQRNPLQIPFEALIEETGRHISGIVREKHDKWDCIVKKSWEINNIFRVRKLPKQRRDQQTGLEGGRRGRYDSKTYGNWL